MATGRWVAAWSCVLLIAASAAGADDVWPMNHRGFQIPISINADRKSEARELILYLSRDKGQTWGIYARATPDKKAFNFMANQDGLLYFSIAVVDYRGVQEPPDVYKAPVGQKILIDTAKPTVRVVSAERVGDEVQVSWEARDENPEWTSLKLEYRVGDSPGAQWVPVPVYSGERGNVKFRPAQHGDVTVRLYLRDVAGNEGSVESVVPAGAGHNDRAMMLTGGTTGGVGSGPVGVAGGGGGIAPPPPAPIGATSMGRPAPQPDEVMPPPPPAGGSLPAPGAMSPSPRLGAGNSLGAGTGSGFANGGTGFGAGMPTRGALPPLQIVNKRQVKLGFDVSKIGHSGLKAVHVFVTEDEGARWDRYAGEPLVTLPVPRSGAPMRGSVTVNLPKDGVPYGFFLILQSQTGILSQKEPQPGTAPQVRLEVDTTLPVAELYAPMPDTTKPNCIVLSWKAEDRNIATNPISLEWSANAAGPWTFIGDAQLPNSGRYSWHVPPNIPPKVFLKLTVRDTAGNAAVAQTDQPVPIDLQVPELGSVQVELGR